MRHGDAIKVEDKEMTLIQARVGAGETVGTTLRLPRQLRDDLRAQAQGAGRSFNTHAVMILRGALHRNEEDRQGGHPDGLEQSNLPERT